MNVNQHPLNQAAQQRAKKDRLVLSPGVPVFQLALEGLNLSEDDPDALRLANAQRQNLVPNSLLLLQDNELTPDDLLTQPLQKLAETIVDALTPSPPAEPA